MTLLNSENLHQGRHVKKSKRVQDMHSPLVETLRTVLRKGEKQGLFRRGVDPVHLYISIAGEMYFYLSNRYTLSRIFRTRSNGAARPSRALAAHYADDS